MTWNVPCLRAAGFTLQILRPVGKHAILSALYRSPHLRPADIHHALSALPAADARLLGVQNLDLAAVSNKIRRLRAFGLVERCGSASLPGSRATYEITPLGAGMVGSLEHAERWGLRHFDLAVTAARARAGLGPEAPPVRSPERRARMACGLALGMFDTRWAFSLLAQVNAAGDAGVESARAQAAVNAAIDGFAEPVRHRLGNSTRHAVLRHLEGCGLVSRRREPRFGRSARVLYTATEAGSSLMDALVPVARWGVPHDAELSAMVALQTPWFADPDAP